jgi:dTDP-4-dehydrorhamnose 3,5-epimerase
MIDSQPMAIRVEPTALEGVLLIAVDLFGDERGYFMETYRRDLYFAAGVVEEFVQDNHSRSRRHVLRGIHLQDETAPMAKLVRCSQGAVLDVAVDLRRGSATFGRWHAEVLSEENCRQMFIPAGFGHGFLTQSEVADVQYKCSSSYAPQSEVTVRWNDPDLAIDWGVESPLVSDRDAKGISLGEYLAKGLNRPTP